MKNTTYRVKVKIKQGAQLLEVASHYIKDSVEVRAIKKAEEIVLQDNPDINRKYLFSTSRLAKKIGCNDCGFYGLTDKKHCPSCYSKQIV